MSDDRQMARRNVTLTARLPRAASPLTGEDQATPAAEIKFMSCLTVAKRAVLFGSFIARKNSVRNCCLSLLSPLRTMKIPVDRYSE
jgi:hypothetical protein